MRRNMIWHPKKYIYQQETNNEQEQESHSNPLIVEK